jgi:tryptophan halogenase
MAVPERITRKLAVFRANGTLEQDTKDLFRDASWLQVMLGQGVMPQDYHPLADSITDDELKLKLENMRKTKLQPMEKIPGHDEFLRTYAGVS